MLEGLVKKLVKQHLGEFVDISDDLLDSVALSIWKGTLQLENISLRTEVFKEKLGSKFELVKGKVGKINIKVPWSSLQSQPVVVQLDEIIVEVKLRGEKAMPADEFVQTAKEAFLRTKRSQVDRFEELSNALANEGTAEVANLSFAGKLTKKIVDNLQIQLGKIFFTLSDENGSQFGIWLKQASLVSVNENWEKVFVVGLNEVRKLFSIEDFYVYFAKFNPENPISNEFFSKSMEERIDTLTPLFFQDMITAKITIRDKNVDNDQESKIDISLGFESAKVYIEKVQVHRVLQFSQAFASTPPVMPFIEDVKKLPDDFIFFEFKCPSFVPKPNFNKIWKFAILSTVKAIKMEKYKDIKIQWLKDVKPLYIELYKRRLEFTKNWLMNLHEREEKLFYYIENHEYMETADIFRLRKYAESELKSTALKSHPNALFGVVLLRQIRVKEEPSKQGIGTKVSSWVSGAWNRAKKGFSGYSNDTEEAVGEILEKKDQLFQTIGYQPDSFSTSSESFQEADLIDGFKNHLTFELSIGEVLIEARPSADTVLMLAKLQGLNLNVGVPASNNLGDIQAVLQDDDLEEKDGSYDFSKAALSVIMSTEVFALTVFSTEEQGKILGEFAIQEALVLRLKSGGEGQHISLSLNSLGFFINNLKSRCLEPVLVPLSLLFIGTMQENEINLEAEFQTAIQVYSHPEHLRQVLRISTDVQKFLQFNDSNLLVWDFKNFEIINTLNAALRITLQHPKNSKLSETFVIEKGDKVALRNKYKDYVLLAALVLGGHDYTTETEISIEEAIQMGTALSHLKLTCEKTEREHDLNFQGYVVGDEDKVKLVFSSNVRVVNTMPHHEILVNGHGIKPQSEGSLIFDTKSMIVSFAHADEKSGRSRGLDISDLIQNRRGAKSGLIELKVGDKLVVIKCHLAYRKSDVLLIELMPPIRVVNTLTTSCTFHFEDNIIYNGKKQLILKSGESSFLYMNSEASSSAAAKVSVELNGMHKSKGFPIRTISFALNDSTKRFHIYHVNLLKNKTAPDNFFLYTKYLVINKTGLPLRCYRPKVGIKEHRLTKMTSNSRELIHIFENDTEEVGFAHSTDTIAVKTSDTSSVSPDIQLKVPETFKVFKIYDVNRKKIHKRLSNKFSSSEEPAYFQELVASNQVNTTAVQGALAHTNFVTFSKRLLFHNKSRSWNIRICQDGAEDNEVYLRLGDVLSKGMTWRASAKRRVKIAVDDSVTSQPINPFQVQTCLLALKNKMTSKIYNVKAEVRAGTLEGTFVVFISDEDENYEDANLKVQNLSNEIVSFGQTKQAHKRYLLPNERSVICWDMPEKNPTLSVFILHSDAAELKVDFDDLTSAQVIRVNRSNSSAGDNNFAAGKSFALKMNSMFVRSHRNVLKLSDENWGLFTMVKSSSTSKEGSAKLCYGDKVHFSTINSQGKEAFLMADEHEAQRVGFTDSIKKATTFCLTSMNTGETGSPINDTNFMFVYGGESKFVLALQPGSSYIGAQLYSKNSSKLQSHCQFSYCGLNELPSSVLELSVTLVKNSHVLTISQKRAERRASDTVMPVGLIGKTVSFSLSIPDFIFSLIDSAPEELMVMYTSLNLFFKVSDETTNLELKIPSFRIDNQLPTAVYPNIISPVVKPMDEEFNKQENVLHFSVIKKNEITDFNYIPYFALNLAELNVSTDSIFINRLLSLVEYYNNLLHDETVDPETTVKQDSLKEDFDIFWATLAKKNQSVSPRNASDIYFFEMFLIYTLRFKLSFQFSDSGSESTKNSSILLDPFSRVFSALSAGIQNIYGAPILFRALTFEHPKFTTEELAKNVVQFYVSEGKNNIFALLGGIGLLGNAEDAVSTLSGAVTVFINEPAQGIVKSPEDFGKGVTKGTKELLKGTIRSFALVTNNLSNTMGKTVKMLTFDDKYVQRRSSKNTHNIQDGLKVGGEELVSSVASGVKGIFTSPIEGAKKKGFGGFVKGLGKGVIGAVAKPADGVLNLVAKTTEGAMAQTKPKPEVFVERDLYRTKFPAQLFQFQQSALFAVPRGEALVVVAALEQLKELGKIEKVGDYVFHKYYKYPNGHLLALFAASFSFGIEMTVDREETNKVQFSSSKSIGMVKKAFGASSLGKQVDEVIVYKIKILWETRQDTNILDKEKVQDAFIGLEQSSFLKKDLKSRVEYLFL
eukprot:snap_masked-scaffold_17-processed-gene-5.35-mRNA-1 protein AED:1.00 eAED:1.00 QI:0/0/0/0/1/1/2/0/2159